MRVRWSDEAASDIQKIAVYLRGKTPLHASRLVQTILLAVARLPDFPGRGRPGKKLGTRELVLAPLPYIVVYTVIEDVIYLVRILHGAQKWP
jgi:addiction module RelE/StbE family toxin